jgi:hypothetical protein
MPNITTNMAARVTSDMTMGGTVVLEFTDLLLSDSWVLIENTIRTRTICSSRIAKSCGIGLDLAIQTEQDYMMFKYFLY